MTKTQHSHQITIVHIRTQNTSVMQFHLPRAAFSICYRGIIRYNFPSQDRQTQKDHKELLWQTQYVNITLDKTKTTGSVIWVGILPQWALSERQLTLANHDFWNATPFEIMSRPIGPLFLTGLPHAYAPLPVSVTTIHNWKTANQKTLPLELIEKPKKQLILDQPLMQKQRE